MPEESASPNPEPTAPQRTPKPKTISARLKAYGWRLTALYVWIHWIFRWIWGTDVLQNIERRITVSVTGFLSAAGFAPVNPEYLPRVFRYGWLFLVTGFTPLELPGIALYILCFPILVLVYVLFRDLPPQPPAGDNDTRPGLRPKTRSIPSVRVATFLLIVWFVLWGGTVSKRPLWIGMFISATLFFVLAYRAFQRARPVDPTNTVILGEFALASLTTAKNVLQKAVEEPPKNRTQLAASLKINRWIEGFIRHVTFFIRGRRGRDRVGALVLTEYVVSLLILGVSGIVFWMFAMKLAAPMISLSVAFRMSSSHFLPGFSAMSPVPLPWWVEFGPAVTAWVLFVLYVGPAASVLPKKQEEVMKRIEPSIKVFRRALLTFGKYRRLFEALKDKLK